MYRTIQYIFKPLAWQVTEDSLVTLSCHRHVTVLQVFQLISVKKHNVKQNHWLAVCIRVETTYLERWVTFSLDQVTRSKSRLHNIAITKYA